MPEPDGNGASGPLSPTRAKVAQCISHAIAPHPWLADLIDRDIAPDMQHIGVDGAINALFSTLGGVLKALDILAAEIDRHDAS
jgi:hypothetical protein